MYNITADNKQSIGSDKRRLETVSFMRKLMDEFTHLQNYSVPVSNGKFATFVIATNDAYYPQLKLKPMDEVWPDCQVGEVNQIFNLSIYLLKITLMFLK